MTGPDKAQRINAGAKRHARDARCRPQPRHTDRCQATTATGCRKPGQRAQPTTNHSPGIGARQHHTNTQQTPARNGGVQAESAHGHTHPDTPARSEQCNLNPSPSTQTHTAHLGHHWRGTSGARTQTHTDPNTPARSGGSQPKPEPKHTHPHCTPQPGEVGYKRSAHTNTHTPKAQAGIEGRSQNRSPHIHTYTAVPSQEWLGTGGARTQIYTDPNSLARSGGAQPKPEPKHKHPHHRPQPGLPGYRRSAHRNTHRPQQPRQEVRGAA